MLRNKTLLTFAFIAAAVGANAGARETDASYYGAPAAASVASRIIPVTAGTKYVRVTNGEVVTFDVDGQRYTWNFQVYGQEASVVLQAILPKEMHADGVTVYVDPDPTYR